MKNFINYKSLDHVESGIVVENIVTSEVLYMNVKSEKLLKVTPDVKITHISQFLTNHAVYDALKNRILLDIKNHEKSEGTIYLKALDGTFLEVDFYCTFLDAENNVVLFTFLKATEVIGESELSFKEVEDHLPTGITVMDIENELSITYANNEHYKILGIEHDEATKTNKYLLKDFIFEEDVRWVLSEIYVHLSKDEAVDIEFRMNTSNNLVKWVRLYGKSTISDNGEKLFYCTIKDLSERVNINDKLHMERILFHKITEIIDETLFRLDLRTNIIHFLGRRNEIFGEITVLENYPDSVLKLYNIHVEDVHIHEEMVDCLRAGVERSIELRYLLHGDEFEWHRITFSFIRDTQGNPISAIGKMANIHAQKILEEQAKTDLLTNFFNKLTTEHEINKLIRTRGKLSHAFFIIDIDNFKAINDNLGHYFGDMVLNDIANDIKSCFRAKDILGRVAGKDIAIKESQLTFRKKDILGRIGGDEFVVVMRDVGDHEIIFDKAQLLCNILSKTFSSGDDINKTYSISASVGISIFPEHGESYEDLYKKSDLALYAIKKTGKNGYKLYSDDLAKQKETFEPKKLDNDNYKINTIHSIVMSTVLNLLYETNNVKATISSILKYLGSFYNVDKCYIFETSDNGNTYNNRYRWHKSGVSKDTEVQISNKHLYSILNKANSDGVFYSNDIEIVADSTVKDILEKENVKSIYLVESLKVKNESLVLGLEDCSSKKIWSNNEVVTLLHIGRLIFTALNSLDKENYSN